MSTTLPTEKNCVAKPESTIPVAYSLLLLLLQLTILIITLTLSACAADTKGGASAKAQAAGTNHQTKDDGVKNTSFNAFREQLLSAVKKHDKEYMESVVSPNIRMVLGGESGKMRFLEDWQQLSPESTFWPRIERLLTHGAQYDSDSSDFNLPAVAFDDSHIDNPQAVVWNKDAKLLKSKERDALVLRKLSGDQLTVLEPSDMKPITVGWVRVQTRDGAEGFMKAEDIYSEYDEFATFHKANGKWTLTWFGVAHL